MRYIFAVYVDTNRMTTSTTIVVDTLATTTTAKWRVSKMKSHIGRYRTRMVKHTDLMISNALCRSKSASWNVNAPAGE